AIHIPFLLNPTSGSKNFVVVTNTILGYAQAYALDADLSATGAVKVDAENTLAADATMHLSAISDGSSKDIILAFNTLGWSSPNIFENVIGVLLSDSQFSSPQSTPNAAYLKDTKVSA